jgi:hypothetical protein
MSGRPLWLLVTLLLALLPSRAVADPLAQVSLATATLSIVVDPVESQPAGAASFAPASDGQTLPVGSRVRTGVGGRAVVTFFDGTAATLEPNSEISLEGVQPSSEQPGGLLTSIGLSTGRVWAQVTSLVNRGSTFEVRGAGAYAAAREGVSGFQVDDEGLFWCWSIDGQPVRIQVAGTEFYLGPGQEVGLAGSAPHGTSTTPPSRPGVRQVGLIGPRAFGAGLLELRSEGAAQLRVIVPQGWTVGFPLSDFVVNQAQDASTSLPEGSSRWIRVPGPRPGLFQLVLEPMENGPYRVRVNLSLDGRELFTQELTGTARVGVPLIADLVVEDRDGVLTGAQLGPIRPLVGPAPGNFVYP